VAPGRPVRGTDDFREASTPMRLSTIKLAGFKSFVDPTTLHLPTNLTAVVGPNGCGKSNIIDAIRWVMGESAASRLRGDSLTDVIFSGSNARKPVGTATVELIFDNSDGTIVGEYGHYTEISVKRSVSRDGSSIYFLNGTRCRRRDITDLFLGTGLGARSYAIIEQGMISEIVEAAPEQLRVHLEEAAGISKYKERRRETENRIRHTRENLERLDDLRTEIGKQIDHLNRQARAAERWQELKAQQALKQAQLKALELRQVQLDLGGQKTALAQQETDLERVIADQRRVESALETVHAAQAQAGSRFNTVQAESYRVAGDIARFEQTLEHQRELGTRLERQQQETAHSLADVDGHIGADQAQIQALREQVAESGPRLESAREQAQTAGSALADAEAALADWQGRYNQHAAAAAESTRAAEVERARIELLDRQCLDADRRLGLLAEEAGRNQVDTLATGLAQTREEEAGLRTQLDTATAGLEQLRQAFAAVEREEQQGQQELAETRKREQSLRGRLASLEALQHAALGEDQPERQALIAELGLAGGQRLGEALQVESGWEAAVEVVLSGWLDAAIQDDPGAFGDALDKQSGQGLTVIAPALADDISPAQSGAAASTTLAAKVRGPAAALALLARVDIVADLASARQRVASLAPGQSLITPGGLWLGRDFVRTVRGDGAQAGVLAREAELAATRAELASLAQRQAALEQQLLAVKERKHEAEIARDDGQRALYQSHRALSEIAGRLSSGQERLENARQRQQQIADESTRLQAQLSADQETVKAGRGRLEQSLARMGELDGARAALDDERRQLLARREDLRLAADRARGELHAIDRELEARRSALASLEQALGRLDAQRNQLQTRAAQLVEQIDQAQAPQAELVAAREAALAQRLVVDKDLTAAREALEAGEAEFRQLEQNRHRLDRESGQAREAIGQARMRVQALSLRAESLSADVVEAGHDAQELCNQLPDAADPDQWANELAEIDRRIRRLEPVNLAAIQEFEEQSRRKDYLDAQNEDLTEALTTLETAIAKIDRETRSRFKDTFDRVNAGIQQLFPRLFGGGHAYLELVGDDLLTTGVAIMARPPGKRVSNISLLSGGEKALTAVSLVFAIFRLNPAPFCLLDEVDAPLDEANVGRFSELVREMSQEVQFVCVTHNKVTMEAAQQLCGVTMREPGVSRLVSVDLAEAAQLAGVS